MDSFLGFIRSQRAARFTTAEAKMNIQKSFYVAVRQVVSDFGSYLTEKQKSAIAYEGKKNPQKDKRGLVLTKSSSIVLRQHVKSSINTLFSLECSALQLWTLYWMYTGTNRQQMVRHGCRCRNQHNMLTRTRTKLRSLWMSLSHWARRGPSTFQIHNHRGRQFSLQHLLQYRTDLLEGVCSERVEACTVISISIKSLNIL